MAPSQGEPGGQPPSPKTESPAGTKKSQSKPVRTPPKEIAKRRRGKNPRTIFQEQQYRLAYKQACKRGLGDVADSYAEYLVAGLPATTVVTKI